MGSNHEHTHCATQATNSGYCANPQIRPGILRKMILEKPSRDLTKEQLEKIRPVVEELLKTNKSSSALARTLGVDASNLSRFVSRRQGMSIPLALAICKEAGVSALEVLGPIAGIGERTVETVERYPLVEVEIADARAAGVLDDELEAGVRLRIGLLKGEPTIADAQKAIHETLAGKKAALKRYGNATAEDDALETKPVKRGKP